jgi:hypothetical protein
VRDREKQAGLGALRTRNVMSARVAERIGGVDGLLHPAMFDERVEDNSAAIGLREVDRSNNVELMLRHDDVAAGERGEWLRADVAADVQSILQRPLVSGLFFHAGLKSVEDAN